MGTAYQLGRFLVPWPRHKRNMFLNGSLGAVVWSCEWGVCYDVIETKSVGVAKLEPGEEDGPTFLM